MEIPLRLTSGLKVAAGVSALSLFPMFCVWPIRISIAYYAGVKPSKLKCYESHKNSQFGKMII